MATESSPNGIPGENLINHYVSIAKNKNVGLITTEYSYIDESGKADLNQVSFADDSVIEAQKVLTGRVHDANPDIKIFAQISHAGQKPLPLLQEENF